MPVSRLRLRLAAGFAVVFLVGLGAADALLFTYLGRQADRRFATQIRLAAEGFVQAVRREMIDTPGGVRIAAVEALKEWPADSNGYVVYDSSGARVATRGSEQLTRAVPPLPHLPADERSWDVPVGTAGSVRLVVARGPLPATFTVVALRSTADLREASGQLAWWLTLSAPLVVLLALVGGYFLARGALLPLSVVTRQITAIAPGDLDRRLPVRSPADELDTLADQFNRLLERLSDAQARNRRFLAQVAHQLKTPLTVIRGESGLGLERPRTVEEYRDLLRRVALAAEQMTHRVDDLFLLAQAAAGDRPPLTDHIELDGLVLECVDLMRGRAGALGQRLELGTVEPAVITGSEPLVREAVLELLENACRHGDAAAPIRIAALGNGNGAHIEVASRGAEIPAALNGGDERPDQSGLGLSIVRWIAGVHGGRLEYRRDADINTLVLQLTAGHETARPHSSTVEESDQ
jgi:signal transduction histidine kinase